MPDFTDPDVRPLWMKDADVLKNLEAEQAAKGLPPIPDIQPRQEVSRVVLERAEGDEVKLPDGRRLTLHKRMIFEMPGTLEGTTANRVQELWKGPKQLRLIRAQEFTTTGMLWQVSFGYPNHLPSLDDAHHIRAAFYDDEMIVAYYIPTPAQIRADPKGTRYMISLMQVPTVFNTIQLPG